MFELNGEYYSLEEIEQAAADSNVSVEDYIAEFSINKVEDVSLDKPEIEQLSSYVDELVGVSKQAKENEETSSLGTFVVLRTTSISGFFGTTSVASKADFV